MKAVVLDGESLNPGDLDWSALGSLVELTVHAHTAPDELAGRAAGAEILLTNKVPLDAATLKALPGLRFISVLATGYNVVDVAHARKLQCYRKIHDYAFAKFPVPRHGEWTQRLDRAGRPATTLVALPVKDPFHLPRSLIYSIEALNRILGK